MPEPQATEWRERKRVPEKREGGTKEMVRDIERRERRKEGFSESAVTF